MANRGGSQTVEDSELRVRAGDITELITANLTHDIRKAKHLYTKDNPLFQRHMEPEAGGSDLQTIPEYKQ